MKILYITLIGTLRTVVLRPVDTSTQVVGDVMHAKSQPIFCMSTAALKEIKVYSL